MFCHTFWNSRHVSQWWIRQFHNSQPGTSLLPSRKPERVERACLFFHSDICRRDVLPVPPACSPPLSLQPLSAEAVWGTTEEPGPITMPSHAPHGGDVPGALLHLPSCKSREAGMLTHTLDATSSVTGEANETASKSQTGDPLAGGKSPGDTVPVVSLAPAPREEQHEVPTERRLPGQLFGNSTSGCICSESHQRPPATQRTREVGKPWGKQA